MTNPYHAFTVRDFVLDDAFRRWVYQPDEQNMTRWHTFMLTNPTQQATIDEAASLLLHLRARYDDLTEASQQRIGQVLTEAALAALPDRSQPAGHPIIVRPLWQRQGFGWRVAACVAALVLMAGATVWFVWIPHQQQVHTAFGENRTVTLPDGSTVLLNGNSTLTFVNPWRDNESRAVWLDGEGFFKVTKQQRSGNPVKFVTHTPGLDITVLGTQFNVNTRRGNTDVTLVEGRVQLAKPGKTDLRHITEMKPGQVASARANIGQVAVRTENARLHTAWTHHTFVFDNTRLSDIARQLGDTYGLDIVFDDLDLANQHFTGNLTNHSTETLLTTLAITFDLTIHRDGNRVILQRNP